MVWAVRTFFLALAFALGGCTLFLAGDPALSLCDTAADCAVGEGCVSGFCKVAAEGEGGEEGEGDEGEGEGEEGEGEGDEGEGEGEGEEGEGEGEGEGEPLPLPKTCEEARVQALPGALPTGTFGIDLDGNGILNVAGGINEAAVFCDMDREGGGWTRIFFLDGADAALACPAVWARQERAGADAFRGCARPLLGALAPAVTADAPHAYTRVMGKMTGVVFGDQDAFAAHDRGINDIYVDGVSLTIGNPREHVFTFIGAHPCYDGIVRCPCDGGTSAPDFVDASFCDRPGQAARPAGCNNGARDFDAATPLWDGPTDECNADADGLFVRDTLQAHTAADDIDIRLMADQNTADENLVLTFVEIYIR
jgi:hypothetical protein